MPLVAVDPTGRAANMLGIVSIACLGANLARIGGGRSWNPIAFIAIITSPVLMALVAYGKNDLLAMAFLYGSIAGSGCEVPSWNFRRGAVAGLFAGMALVLKPSVALPLIPWSLLLAWRLRRRPGLIVLFACVAATLPGAWLMRNLWVAGVPWSPNYVIQSASTIHQVRSGLVERLAGLGASFYAVGAFLDGPTGPVILALALLALLAVRDEARSRPMTLACAGGFLLWAFIGGRYPRHFFSVVLLWSSLGASSRIARSTPGSILLLALAVFSLAAGAILLERSSGFLDLVSGRVGSDDFLACNIESYRLQREASRVLPRDAVVLSVGEPRVFFLERRARFDLTWRDETAFAWAHESHDASALRDRMRSCGITHVFYNPVLLAESLASGD